MLCTRRRGRRRRICKTVGSKNWGKSFHPASTGSLQHAIAAFTRLRLTTRHAVGLKAYGPWQSVCWSWDWRSFCYDVLRPLWVGEIINSNTEIYVSACPVPASTLCPTIGIWWASSRENFYYTGRRSYSSRVKLLSRQRAYLQIQIQIFFFFLLLRNVDFAPTAYLFFFFFLGGRRAGGRRGVNYENGRQVSNDNVNFAVLGKAASRFLQGQIFCGCKKPDLRLWCHVSLCLLQVLRLLKDKRK